MFNPHYIPRTVQRIARRAPNYLQALQTGASIASTLGPYMPVHPSLKRLRGNSTFIPSKRSRINRRTGGFNQYVASNPQELKFIDTFDSFVPSGGTLPVLIPLDSDALATVNHMTPVAQGTGPDQRIGRNIRVKSVASKIGVQIGSATHIDTTSFSVPEATFFFVLDKQANSATPTAASIWVNPTGSGAMGGRPLLNLEFKDRFKILGTRHVTWPDINHHDSSGNYINNGRVGYTDFYKEFKKNKKQQFDGPTGSIADVSSWSISIWAHINSAPLGTVFFFHNRARYYG